MPRIVVVVGLVLIAAEGLAAPAPFSPRWSASAEKRFKSYKVYKPEHYLEVDPRDVRADRLQGVSVCILSFVSTAKETYVVYGMRNYGRSNVIGLSVLDGTAVVSADGTVYKSNGDANLAPDGVPFHANRVLPGSVARGKVHFKGPVKTTLVHVVMPRFRARVICPVKTRAD